MSLRAMRRNSSGVLEAHEVADVYPAKRDDNGILQIYRGETYGPVKRSGSNLHGVSLNSPYTGISFDGELIVDGRWDVSTIHRRTTDAWEKYGTGTARGTDALLTLGGELYAVSNANTYRLDSVTSVWETISNPSGGSCYDAIVHNGELWIGMVPGSVPGVFVRQSGSWVNKLSASGYSFASSGSTLWACASFNIYEWDGSTFNSIIGKTAFAMCYFSGKLTYWQWDGNADSGVYQWDGSTSTQIGTDKFRSHNGGLCHLFADGTDLLAASISDFVYKWNGTSWSQMGNLDGVSYLFKHNSDLYASGFSSDIPGIYRWDDPDWTLV